MLPGVTMPPTGEIPDEWAMLGWAADATLMAACDGFAYGPAARLARRGGAGAALDSYYNAIGPNSGNDTWLLQFTVTFVFPK